MEICNNITHTNIRGQIKLNIRTLLYRHITLCQTRGKTYMQWNVINQAHCQILCQSLFIIQVFFIPFSLPNVYNYNELDDGDQLFHVEW